MLTYDGRVAQLEERGVCNAEAWGSNPHTSIRQNLVLVVSAPGNASYRGRVESQ